jgi:hypothetical protein
MMAEADAKIARVQKFDDWPYIGQSALVGFVLPVCIHVALSVAYHSDGQVGEGVNEALKLLYLVPVWQIFLLIKHIVEKVVSGTKDRTVKRPLFFLSALFFTAFHVALIALSGLAFRGFTWSL